MRFIYIALFLSLLSLTACQTQDYYRDRAVNRAREYAIPRLRDLSETQLDYIRYSPPALMEVPVFQRYETKDKTPAKNDIYQTCIVWNVPELDYSILVFGVSERRMNDWYPDRVIRKKFNTTTAARDEAVRASVEYAMNNMLYLSDEMRNRVRFSPPDDYRTNFEIDQDKYKSKKKMTRREKDLDAYKKSRYKQYSFVWNTDNDDEKIVISGVCFDNFDSWQPLNCMLRSKKDIEEHTVKEEKAAEKPADTKTSDENTVKKTEPPAKQDEPEVTEITESPAPIPSNEKNYESVPGSDSDSGFKQLNKFQR